MEELADDEKLKAMDKELVKSMKTYADLSAVVRQLTKTTIETALEAGMDGNVKHDSVDSGSGNSRNGTSVQASVWRQRLS